MSRYPNKPRTNSEIDETYLDFRKLNGGDKCLNCDEPFCTSRRISRKPATKEDVARARAHCQSVLDKAAGIKRPDNEENTTPDS